MVMTSAERQRRFVGKKRQDGLVKLTIFAPAELADEIRAYYAIFPECKMPEGIVEHIGICVRVSDGTMRTIRAPKRAPCSSEK